MRRLSAPVLAALALVLCAGAGAAVPLAAPTPVRAWGGVAVLSIREGKVFRLAMQSAQEAPRVLPGIAPSQEPFEAGIGPGPDGSAVIVFARCTGHRRCRLMRTTPFGEPEHPIAGTAGLHGFEHAPAVWGNRLVFARRLGNGLSHVYVRPLDAARSVRSSVLPDPSPPPCTPEGPEFRCYHEPFSVVGLSLRGSLLAETLDRGFVHSFDLCTATEVRLVDIATRRARRISWTSCGLAGETLLDASVTARHVLWARICPGDQNGCGGEYTQLYSYALRDHRVEHAAQSSVLVDFTAEDDNHVVEVAAPETENEGDCENFPYPGPQPPCQLIRLGPVPFAPLRRPAPLVSGLAVRSGVWP